MIRLIKNELLKLRHRPIIYMAFALIIVAVAVLSAFAFNDNIQKKKELQARDNNLAKQVAQYQQLYDKAAANEDKEKTDIEKSDQDKAYVKKSLDSAKYCLDNNIRWNDPRNELVSIYFDNKDNEDPEMAKWAQTVKEYIENDDLVSYYRDIKLKTEKSIEALDKSSEEYKWQQLQVEELDMRLKYKIFKYTDNYKDVLINQYFSNKSQILISEYGSKSKRDSIDVPSLQKRNKVLLYRMENDIPEISSNVEANLLKQFTNINILIIIIMFVIGATIFTSEFSYGTVGQLLIYPQKRYKVILSKLAVIIGLTILMQAVLYGSSLLAANLAVPSGANTYHMLFLQGDTIYLLDFYYYLFLKYLCYFAQFLFYLSIILFLSLITKNAAATIGITIPVLLAIPAILTFVNTKAPNLILWPIPFNAANFNQYLDMEYSLPGYDLPWAIVITAATMAVLSFFGFRRFRRINI